MCFHAVPNGTHCREYIKAGICVAVVEGKPTCQSINGTSHINLFATETLIRDAIAKKSSQPISLHQMQAQIAISDLQ